MGLLEKHFMDDLLNYYNLKIDESTPYILVNIERSVRFENVWYAYCKVHKKLLPPEFKISNGGYVTLVCHLEAEDAIAGWSKLAYFLLSMDYFFVKPFHTNALYFDYLFDGTVC